MHTSVPKSFSKWGTETLTLFFPQQQFSVFIFLNRSWLFPLFPRTVMCQNQKVIPPSYTYSLKSSAKQFTIGNGEKNIRLFPVRNMGQKLGATTSILSFLA